LKMKKSDVLWLTEDSVARPNFRGPTVLSRLLRFIVDSMSIMAGISRVQSV
jgi:hypothetical protein